MSKAIGKIKPKRVMVRILPDGTRQIVDPKECEAAELQSLSMPKSPKNKENKQKEKSDSEPKGRLLGKA